ncbi:hypothetical protein SMALA_4176 [Streptomyces malaysiensis subsp. malaysiensis]|nr:hypothetical protein SMALA_4176 [Streptomyces malaysiensis]
MVTLPEPEPAAHLHHRGGIACTTSVVGDGEAFDGKAPGQFLPADEDLPDGPTVEVRFAPLDVLVTVDHDDRSVVGSDAGPSRSHMRRQVVIGAGDGETVGSNARNGKEIRLEEFAQPLPARGAGVAPLVPQTEQPPPQLAVLCCQPGLVYQHGVVPEVVLIHPRVHGLPIDLHCSG